MKHPVLRVKKGTESYDDTQDRFAEARAEAEGQRHPPAQSGKRRSRSFFRLRPGSLLPLFVLVLIAAIILKALPGSAARANVHGWHALLEARVIGDALHVGVAFSRLNPVGVDNAPQAVSVLFILPETGEQAEALGTLSDSRVALRSQMRYVASERMLRAIVRIDGQSRTLSLPIPGP